MYSAFPEIHFTIDDMVVEGDKVAVRYTISGTHKGEFMGVPPTNRKLTLWGICIDRIAGGRFVESWVRYDTLGFKQQLGLVPTSDRSNLKRVCSSSSIDDRCMGSGEINDAEAVGDGAEAFGGCLRVPGAGDRHKSHKHTRLTNHGVGVGRSNTAVVGHR